MIEPALKTLLATEPSARLLLVGKLAFDEAFSHFGDRFEYKPFAPYDTFMHCLGDADINLVPLETDSPFAQARSELKYIEAGAFGVPTVASPTDTYAAAIRHGETGLLCGQADWLATLAALVREPDRRSALGGGAGPPWWSITGRKPWPSAGMASCGQSRRCRIVSQIVRQSVPNRALWCCARGSTCCVTGRAGV